MLYLVPLIDAHCHRMLLVTIIVVHSGSQRIKTLQTGVCRQSFQFFRRKHGRPGVIHPYGKHYRQRDEDLSKHGFVFLKGRAHIISICARACYCYLCTFMVLPSFLYRVTIDGFPLSNTPSMRSPLSAITSFVLTTLCEVLYLRTPAPSGCPSTISPE